jgi:hypothetical protein
MSLQDRLRAVPRLLLVEAALGIVIIVVGIVPFAVFTTTGARAPRGFDTVWTVPLVRSTLRESSVKVAPLLSQRSSINV